MFHRLSNRPSIGRWNHAKRNRSVIDRSSQARCRGSMPSVRSDSTLRSSNQPDRAIYRLFSNARSHSLRPRCMRDRYGDADLSRSIGIETAASDTEFDVNLYRTASRIDRWGPSRSLAPRGSRRSLLAPSTKRLFRPGVKWCLTAAACKPSSHF